MGGWVIICMIILGVAAVFLLTAAIVALAPYIAWGTVIVGTLMYLNRKRKQDEGTE